MSPITGTWRYGVCTETGWLCNSILYCEAVRNCVSLVAAITDLALWGLY